MSHELKEGLEIESVGLPAGQILEAGVGEVESISITEQKGQMSMVPYVRIFFKDKSAMFIDASHCHGIVAAAPVKAA